MENIFRGQPGTNSTLEHVERATNLLLQGLNMASELRTSVTTVLNLHAKLSVPLTKYVQVNHLQWLPFENGQSPFYVVNEVTLTVKTIFKILLAS